MLGEIANARQIFERWMSFHPNDQAWLSYIKLEVRHGQIERARALYERFTVDHLTLDAYLKWAKFETRYGTMALARGVYERAQEELAEEERSDERFYIAFAHFEERNKEYERARCIYQYALDHLPKARARDLYDKYVAFEKSFGDKEGVELVILSKKRFQYEEEIKSSAAVTGTGAAYNYDIWFDYLRLEQDRLESVQTSLNPAVNTAANVSVQCARIRELFERAVANVPLVLTEKKYFKRYIYLWINWLLFEELTMRDVARTREIFLKLLGPDLIPHATFSFAKLWLQYAHFEIRQGELDRARMKLGEGLGRVQNPRTKAKLFKGYLELELHLGALDRVRKLYEKSIEFSPSTSDTWIEFASFEQRLGEGPRARAIFELAVAQQALDQPERVWKSYIELEAASGEVAHVRALYTRLLEKTKHVKVWIAHAQFEVQHKALDRARDIFAKGEEHFKATMQRIVEEEASSAGPAGMGVGMGVHASPLLLQIKEERLLLLQSWRDLERTYGDATTLAAINAKLPQQLKKRRAVYVSGVDGEATGGAGYEEVRRAHRAHRHCQARVRCGHSSTIASSCFLTYASAPLLFVCFASRHQYYDYVYPEESAKAAAAGGTKFMEMAKNWKRQQEMKQAAEQARLEAEVAAEEKQIEEQRNQEEIDIENMEEEGEGEGEGASSAAAASSSEPGGMQSMEQ